MTGELTHFLKGHAKASELLRDEDFLTRNRMGHHPDNPNVIGVYMGKQWEYIDGTKWVRPVDGEEPRVLPHRR